MNGRSGENVLQRLRARPVGYSDKKGTDKLRTTKVFDHLWATGNKPVPGTRFPDLPAHHVSVEFLVVRTGTVFCWILFKSCRCKYRHLFLKDMHFKAQAVLISEPDASCQTSQRKAKHKQLTIIHIQYRLNGRCQTFMLDIAFHLRYIWKTLQTYSLT